MDSSFLAASQPPPWHLILDILDQDFPLSEKFPHSHGNDYTICSVS
jgi:hypothetical protein